ncbi:hypothetical protein JY651_18230 [Pyxidicoccus parkwayensis]|uniref:Lipoprotein n=1 Tax=Pyxidicoccus parkwayensis TaxID=2813578 RepID=A0ABX7P8J6_9BACT|nr:hypothetical protein [Pyxidicoccus parkwaysis]QSQ26742.1 hypothetical protein JY651_18230 [Pyxidicoccus parkwaysis]
MRPYLLLAALLLLAISGCNDSDSNDSPDSGIPEVPKSSFATCSFSEACANAAERCYVSQECPPASAPGTDAGTCAPETGDRLCHRRCDSDGTCGASEHCEEVFISMRSDYSERVSLCFD